MVSVQGFEAPRPPI